MEQLGWILVAVLILNALYYLLPSILVYRLRRTDIIRKRGYGLLITQAATTFVTSSAVITMLNCFVQYQQQCIIIVTAAQVFGMIPTYIYLTRALNLIYENCRTRIAINSETDGSLMIKLTLLERFSDAYFGFFRCRLGARANSGKENQSLSSTLIDERSRIGAGKESGPFNGEISNRVLLLSLVPYSLFTVILLVFPFTLFTNDLMILHGCPNFLIFTPTIILLGSLLLLIPLMLQTIFWIKDGLGMRDEISLSCVASGIMFVPFIVGFLANDSPFVFGNALYSFLICFNSQLGGMIYPLYLVYQHKYRKANLKMTMDDFDVVLNNPDLYKELRNLLVRELCIENALFLEELDRVKTKFVKRHHQNASISTFSCDQTADVRKKVIGLHKKYVEAGAHFELNIPSKLARTIKTTIEENSYAGLEVFDELRDLVRMMIYENTYQRFVQEMSAAKKKSGSK